MQKSNPPKKLAIKIVLLLLAALWIGSIFYPSAPTPPQNVSEYVRSERELDGLEVALGNLKAGDPLSGSFDFSDWISPNFEWVAREKNNVLTISSVADRNISFESPLPPDTNWRFWSWSPDSTGIAGVDCLSCLPTDIRYVQFLIFEIVPDQEKIISHIVPFSSVQKMDSTAMLGQAIVWSPNSQYVAMAGEAGQAILIFNREGKRIDRIEINPIETLATSNILWSKHGIIYIVQTWHGIYEITYEIRMVDPFGGEEIALWEPEESSQLPKMLGSRGAFALFAREITETEVELVAINLETHRLQKVWRISAREVSQTDRFNLDDPYLVFNVQSIDLEPQIWFLDWDSLAEKFMFSNVDFDTMGWSSVLNGIGVFRKRGKGIELWVVKP